MFMKTLTAGLLAVSLTFTSLTPTTASAGLSDEEALAGLVALLLLGAAINHSQNDGHVAPAPNPRPHPQPGRGWRVLPDECLFRVTRRNGDPIRFFGQRCLNRSYAHTNRLPAACHIQFRTTAGQFRQGYRAQCMRNAGFRTSRQ